MKELCYTDGYDMETVAFVSSLSHEISTRRQISIFLGYIHGKLNEVNVLVTEFPALPVRATDRTLPSQLLVYSKRYLFALPGVLRLGIYLLK
jgi:hypothetical protein